MKQQNNKTNSNKPFDGIKRLERVSCNSESNQNKISTNWFLDTVKSSGLKLAIVVAFTFILSVSLSSVGSTVSYFNDLEVSFGNYLKADPLGFKVLINGVNTAQVDLGDGETMFVPEMIPNSDSEPIQYFVTSKITGGDSGLCNSVNVMGTYPFPYDGKVALLSTATSTQVGSWALSFTLPNSENFINSSCTMDLVYKGWNADSNYGSGYSDTQVFSITFYVPNVVQPLKLSSPIIILEEEVATTTPAVDTVSIEIPKVIDEPISDEKVVEENKLEEVIPEVKEEEVVVENQVVPNVEVSPEIPTGSSE